MGRIRRPSVRPSVRAWRMAASTSSADASARIDSTARPRSRRALPPLPPPAAPPSHHWCPGKSSRSAGNAAGWYATTHFSFSAARSAASRSSGVRAASASGAIRRGRGPESMRDRVKRFSAAATCCVRSVVFRASCQWVGGWGNGWVGRWVSAVARLLGRGHLAARHPALRNHLRPLLQVRPNTHIRKTTISKRFIKAHTERGHRDKERK